MRVPVIRVLVIAMASLVALGTAALGSAPQQTSDYGAVLADADRPEAERARDAARKAAETLAFAQVRPGQKVADMIIGGGYFTRLFAAAVGQSGHVTAWQPEEFVAFQASYGEALTTVDAAHDNVVGVQTPIDAPTFPAGLDLVFTAQNYHDLHLRHFPQGTAERVNAAVFAALKPGGLYVIVDHSASPGAGLGVAHTLHRIDIADVRREVEAAGFVLEAQSDILARPDDPRTANVFDPGIRGRTDQFMLRFRKPA